MNPEESREEESPKSEISITPWEKPSIITQSLRGESGSDAWEEYGIQQSPRGVPVPNLAGITCILGEHPHWKGRIWWDDFLEKVVFRTEDNEAREWDDDEDRKALIWMQSVMELYNAGSSEVRDAVKSVAKKNRRNELTEWLNSLLWDDKPRVEFLFSRGFGARPSQYIADVGRCWLISAIARAFEPGCKVDTLPILEGSQGAGKSSGLRVLGGQWFGEMHSDIGNKEFYEILKGKWIIELSEMHSLSKAETNKVKGIISNQIDRYRIPYEAHASDHPRRSVFAGTTNRDDWQIDATGARRFWPVRCGKVDLEWLKANRDQLFAEAVSLWRAGERWWTVNAEVASAEAEKSAPEDPWEAILKDDLREYREYSLGEILSSQLGIEAKDQSCKETRRVAEILRKLGWERFSDGKQRRWRFTDGTDAN